MSLTKTDWYIILLAILVFALVGINELGYGGIGLLPLLLLAYWLMTKAFETDKPDYPSGFCFLLGTRFELVD